MRNFGSRLAAGAVATVLSAAAAGGAHADGAVNTGLFGGVAIKGYDPVADFTEGRAMKGSPDFAVDWLGTPWHFANATHRDLFAADPVGYAPQYGGYCALGVGFDGHATENIDPERAWRIIDGKLYLVADPVAAEELDGPARQAWLTRADAQWPDLEARLEAGGFH